MVVNPACFPRGPDCLQDVGSRAGAGTRVVHFGSAVVFAESGPVSKCAESSESHHVPGNVRAASPGRSLGEQDWPQTAIG